MERSACLEVRPACSSCGQSLPGNGPYREVTCTACSSELSVAPDIPGGLPSGFEGLVQGQDTGGALMSGCGT